MEKVLVNNYIWCDFKLQISNLKLITGIFLNPVFLMINNIAVFINWGQGTHFKGRSP